MVDQTSKLKIEITGDAQKDIRAINKSLAMLDKRGEQASKRTRRLSNELDRAARAGKRFGAALGGAATGGLFLAIRNSIAQEKAVRGLEAVLRSTGNTIGLTSQEIQTLAADLQTLTGIGDEATIEMQKLLGTFTNIRGDVFVRATQAVQDLAVTFDRDLNEVAIQLGKALQDPVKGMTALTRAGITFTDQQREQAKAMQENNDLAGAQAIVFEEVEKQVQGAAEAYRNTLGGALQAVNSAFGDLFEQDTQPLIDALNDLERVLTNPNVQAAITNIATTLLKLFTFIVRHADTILEVMGAVAGAYAGAKVGASLGAKAGPQGVLAGAAIGGVAGGLGGFFGTRGAFGFADLSEQEIAEGEAAARERIRQLREDARRQRQITQQQQQQAEDLEFEPAIVRDAVDMGIQPSEFAVKWREAFDSVEDGLESYAGTWKDTQREIEDITVDAFRRLEDEIVEFASTGKFAFKDMVNSMLRDILRLTVRQGITGPIASALGGVLGSAFGNFGRTPAPVTDLSVPVTNPSVNIGQTTPLVPTQQYQQGTPYVPRTGLALVHQGERITPAAANRSGEGKTTVVVNEAPAGTMVESSTAPDGSELINVMLGAMREDLREGASAQILQNTFNARRAGVFR